MLAELHARWEREDEIASNNKMNVCTITTTSNTKTLSANIPSTTNAKIVNEEKPTFSTKSLKLSNLFLISVLKFFKVEEILLLLLIIMTLILIVAIFLKLLSSYKSLLKVLMLVP